MMPIAAIDAAPFIISFAEEESQKKLPCYVMASVRDNDVDTRNLCSNQRCYRRFGRERKSRSESCLYDRRVSWCYGYYDICKSVSGYSSNRTS